MKSIKDRLEAEEPDELLVKLLAHLKGKMKSSREKMSEHYSTWDKHREVYRGERPVDKDDLQAREHGEPEKLVVPMSFAQVQTFVAFTFLLFKQNRRFFEFVATGGEDYQVGYDAEEVLERDLRRNFFDRILYQLLLDAATLNIGVVKHWWEVETQWATVNTPASEMVAGDLILPVAATTSSKEFTKYEGNKLQSISPYNFFPDTRFPLAEWRRGSFVGDETEYHISQLKKWEHAGLMFGVDYIEPAKSGCIRDRGGDTRLEAFKSFCSSRKKDKDDQIVCLTSIQTEIIPSKYKLGPEEYPVKYIISYANDSRIVSITPAGYLHDEYTYDVSQYSPDIHQDIGCSLSDTIFAMQDVVSYLINTRLTSVRRSLERNLIIDPSSVDMASVESRSPYILMKKGSPRLGVDKFVRQLQYVDTTAKHLEDADMIMKIMQLVTGVNENAMGQFSGGRRSATEARAANGGAASRMKLVASLIWSDCLSSLGRKLLFNSRQGISLETFIKVLGPSAGPRYELFHPSDPSQLIGSEDHFVFDSTLQSEKGFIAQSLQELVSAVLSNPIVMQVLPIDVGKVMEEILVLRGVENIERFRIQPAIPQNAFTGQDPTTQAQAPGTPGAPAATPGLPTNTPF